MPKGKSLLFNLWLVCAAVASGLPSNHHEARAEVATILFLAAVAVAVIAGLLLKPSTPAPQRDTRPPTTSRRGEQLPYVIGRRIVDPIIFRVGRREEREESLGGGKGFKGGGAKGIFIYEDAVHGITLGPANVLYAIRRSSETVIFQGPISPDTTPSGSLLHDVDGNAFKIYWGDRDQPINNDLAGDDMLGVASRWPYHCYVHWIQRRLGSVAVWPQIDYDIAANCVGFVLPGSSCSFGESIPGLEDTGVNGAHAIYQLWTGSYPHGGGNDPSEIDFGSLCALGELLETERLPQNILIAQGTSLADTLNDILSDISCFMAQKGDRLVFMPIRSGDTAISLDERVLVIPPPQYEVAHGNYQNDRLLFTYPDVKNLMRDSDVVTDDDATARSLRRKKSQEVRLPTITDQATAARAADRRKLLYLADANQIEFEGNRTLTQLVPGQVAILPELGQIRVTAIENRSDSPRAKLTASINAFSLEESLWIPNNPGSGGSGGEPGTIDSLDIPIEIPNDIIGNVLALGVIRARTDGRGIASTVWVSTDGTTYEAVGPQVSSAAGAILLEDLPETSDMIVEVGPKISITTAAVNRIQDLTSNVNAWLSGQQVLLIKDVNGEVEAMFLQGVTAITGGYRLHGVARARLHTRKLDHLVGQSSIMGIIPSSALRAFTSLNWSIGQTLHIKVQPSGVPLDTITPVTLELTGKAFSALPIDNLSPLKRPTSSDIEFHWTDRIRKGTGTGAGEGACGIEIGPTPAPDTTTYRFEIFDTAMVLRATRVVTGVNGDDLPWTYDTAAQTADGVAATDFFLRVTPMIHSFFGYPRTFFVEVIS